MLASANAARWALAFLVCCNAGVLADKYSVNHDLAKLEEAIHRVTAESAFLKTRADNLLAQKDELEEDIVQLTSGAFGLSILQEAQDVKLRVELADTIKELYHIAGDLGAGVAEAVSVAYSNKDLIIPTFDEINFLAFKLGTHQTEGIWKAKLKIDDEKDKVLDLIKLESDWADITLQKTEYNLGFSDYIQIPIDPALAEGQGNFTLIDNSDGFSGQIPTVLCGIQSIIESEVKLDSDKHYGGYGYGRSYKVPDDQVQNYAVTVDCKASYDRVDIRVFDQSHGYGNRIDTVVVEVRVCSFAAATGSSGP